MVHIARKPRASAGLPRARVRLPEPGDDLPVMYEDDDEGDMGDAFVHSQTIHTLYAALEPFVAVLGLRFFDNMNAYYEVPKRRQKRGKGWPYFSADGMIVEPFQDLGDDVTSYRIGVDGPAPRTTFEVLSERTFQQGDLKTKPILYGKLGVREYILIDVRGRFLKERLLLRRLQPNGKWKDERDADGGVTSELGFRLIVDTDQRLRVINAATGLPFVRPEEANQAAENARRAEAQLARSNRTRLAAERAKGEAERAKDEAERAKDEAHKRIAILEAELERLRGRK